MKSIKNKELIIFGAIAVFLFIDGIRVCPFYLLFKIPCPGCGLTRSFMELAHFHIKEAFHYNILFFPVLLILIYELLPASFIIKKKLHEFITKHQTVIIVSAVILTAVSFIVNLHNPLLY